MKAQNINNFPESLLKIPAFFKVGANKQPHVKDWGNPQNQKYYNQVDGILGFDISKHNILVFDFDHAFDQQGNWVNEKVQKTYQFLSQLHSYTEISISGRGLHIVMQPTKGKFQDITNASKNVLYFDDNHKDKNCPKLEIYYGSKAKYFLFTGNVYECEPKTPIVTGQQVDSLLTKILAKISETSVKSPDAREENIINNSKELPLPQNDLDYDRARAVEMLKFIDPSIGYTDWLNVGMALKNIGCNVTDWDNWSSKSDKYKEGECSKKWDSFNGSGLGIGTIHDLAKAGGYDEKSFKREYGKKISSTLTPAHPSMYPSVTIRRDSSKPVPIDEKGERLKAELELARKNVSQKLTDELMEKFLKSYLTDLDCTDLFCAIYKDYRYNRTTKAWYHYDGCKWSIEDDERPILALWAPIIKCVVLKAHLNAHTLQFEEDNKIKAHHSKKIKWAWKTFNQLVPYQNLRKLNAVTNTISIRPDVYINDDKFDVDKCLFNTPNATINLKTLQTKEHDPFDYCTMSSSASLDKDFFNLLDDAKQGKLTCGAQEDILLNIKKCKEWEAFIQSAVPDYHTRNLLQKYIGYCMSGLTSLKVFFFIHGVADTGKSLLIRAIKRVFGEYAKAFPMEYIMANRKELNGEEPTPILFSMRHARLAISSETKSNRKFDTAKLKMLTGEDPITARTLHKPPIEFIPQFKFLFVGNFAPKVDNIYDSGVRTRLRIIQFKNVPKKKNTMLDEIFSRPENQTAILNWVLQGAFAVMEDIENGINPFDIDNLSPEMKQALAQFYDSSDHIPTFLEDENYQLMANQTVYVKTIWIDYLGWCKINDERHLRRSDFENNLLTRYPNVKIIQSPAHHKGKIFEGIYKAA